jgi:hypothetical protein
MLEALQDIEIASRLVGFNGDNDESLDEKYKKLHCDITPLAHDSEDYKLVKKYLLNTHAPTHKVRCKFLFIENNLFMCRLKYTDDLLCVLAFIYMLTHVLFCYFEGLVIRIRGSLCARSGWRIQQVLEI